jgi:hypothetical protein
MVKNCGKDGSYAIKHSKFSSYFRTPEYTERGFVHYQTLGILAESDSYSKYILDENGKKQAKTKLIQVMFQHLLELVGDKKLLKMNLKINDTWSKKEFKHFISVCTSKEVEQLLSKKEQEYYDIIGPEEKIKNPPKKSKKEVQDDKEEDNEEGEESDDNDDDDDEEQSSSVQSLKYYISTLESKVDAMQQTIQLLDKRVTFLERPESSPAKVLENLGDIKSFIGGAKLYFFEDGKVSIVQLNV